MGRSQEAEAPLQRAFNMADDFVHRDPNDQNSRGRLAVSGIVLADILRHSDPPRSMAVYEHVLRHIAEVKNNLSFRRYEVSVLAGSSYSLLRLGRTSEARRRIDDAFERLRQLNLYPAERIDAGVEVDKALSARADYEGSRGRSLAALGIYEELLRKVMATGPKLDTSLTDAFNLSRIYAAIANLESAIGRIDGAAEFRKRRLELWRHWDAKLPNNNFVRRQLSAATEPFHESGGSALTRY
jgi:tetratricopeptide (TPR) repeat protein